MSQTRTVQTRTAETRISPLARPLLRRGQHLGRNEAAVFAIASRLLLYPDGELLEALPDVDRLAAGLPRRLGRPLLAFSAGLRSAPLLELQARYVETFDLRRRNCLHLTYARAGDTRGRGAALLRFTALYGRRGYRLDHGELADFLPALLELAAQSDPDDSEPFEMLVEHRPEIGLLRTSLESSASPYADIVRVIEAVLPRPNARQIEAMRKLIEDGPPEEQVGVISDARWLRQGGTFGGPTRETAGELGDALGDELGGRLNEAAEAAEAGWAADFDCPAWRVDPDEPLAIGEKQR